MTFDIVDCLGCFNEVSTCLICITTEQIGFVEKTNSVCQNSKVRYSSIRNSFCRFLYDIEERNFYTVVIRSKKHMMINKPEIFAII